LAADRTPALSAAPPPAPTAGAAPPAGQAMDRSWFSVTNVSKLLFFDLGRSRVQRHRSTSGAQLHRRRDDVLRTVRKAHAGHGACAPRLVPAHTSSFAARRDVAPSHHPSSCQLLPSLTFGAARAVLRQLRCGGSAAGRRRREAAALQSRGAVRQRAVRARLRRPCWRRRRRRRGRVCPDGRAVQSRRKHLAARPVGAVLLGVAAASVQECETPACNLHCAPAQRCVAHSARVPPHPQNWITIGYTQQSWDGVAPAPRSPRACSTPSPRSLSCALACADDAF